MTESGLMCQDCDDYFSAARDDGSRMQWCFEKVDCVEDGEVPMCENGRQDELCRAYHEGRRPIHPKGEEGETQKPTEEQHND